MTDYKTVLGLGYVRFSSFSFFFAEGEVAVIRRLHS